MLRRALQVVPVLAAIAVVAIGVSLGFSPSAPPLVPSAAAAESSASIPKVMGDWPDARPSAPTSFVVADATGPVVHLFSAPDVAYEPRPTMDNPTWEGLPVVFLVMEEQGPWLHVRVSSRPNDLTAWVQRDEVSLRTVANRVVIEVGARRVTVYHGDEVLLQAPVAVGADRTPTPIGSFFVDGIVQVPNAAGPYGPFQVSVSGFSNVLQSFGGGIGQIAMHGTNRPELLGQPISNGCIRMDNTVISQMAAMAPLGTPVEVVA